MVSTIVMLEYDPDDRYITQSFFDEHHLPVKIDFVYNTEQLFRYLHDCGTSKAFPSIILLNVQAGPLGAVETIRSLKGTPTISKIPVIVLSGIHNNEKSSECYGAGAASFIVKPHTEIETTEKILSFFMYWFRTVDLPVIN